MGAHEIEALARQLMRQHGLAEWDFGFNRRKRALGLCRYVQQRIELSVYFVISHGEVEIRDVILHEIAHALAGHAAAHGPRWRAICRQIGAKPERCSDAVMPPGRWQAACPSCQRKFNRCRRPLRNRRYMCPKCGIEKGRLMFSSRRVAQ